MSDPQEDKDATITSLNIERYRLRKALEELEEKCSMLYWHKICLNQNVDEWKSKVDRYRKALEMIKRMKPAIGLDDKCHRIFPERMQEIAKQALEGE